MPTVQFTITTVQVVGPIVRYEQFEKIVRLLVNLDFKREIF